MSETSGESASAVRETMGQALEKSKDTAQQGVEKAKEAAGKARGVVAQQLDQRSSVAGERVSGLAQVDDASRWTCGARATRRPRG